MYRMLIVDDEERIVNSLYGLMQERFEMEIYKAFSGAEAKEMISRMRFDIVITDIDMPQINGLELLTAIRQRWTECYVILLTAYDKFDYAYEALRCERVDYLLKVESYDEISRVVGNKICLMDKERSERERVLKLSGDLNAVSSGIRDYVLKRFIVQGVKLPDQKDLHSIGLTIRLDHPAMLVLGTLDVDDPVERKRVMAAIDEYMREQVAPRVIDCYSHVSAGYVFFIAQGQDEAEAQELTVFLREVFEELPQAVEGHLGHRLTLLCTDTMVKWEQMHRVFKRATAQLEQMRNESGMMTVCVAELLQENAALVSFPSVEEMSILWEMIRCGNTQELIARLREGFEGLVQAPDFNALLPCTGVSAMAFLLSEAATLLEPEKMRDPGFIRLLRCEGFSTGEQWVQSMENALLSIINHRDESQKNVDRWLIKYINQYVEENYANDITLTLLADQVHYSPAYISRVYKQETGKNLLQHIVGVRIAYARQMLTQSSMKLSEIAQRCGFCSTKYFNQVFKRNMGMSAAQYREENMRQPNLMHKNDMKDYTE